MKLLEIVHWKNERLVANGDSLIYLLKTLLPKSGLPEYAPHALFTSHLTLSNLSRGAIDLPPVDNIAGIAIPQICGKHVKPFDSRVIVEKGYEEHMAGILLHELGHALGMEHSVEWPEKYGIPEGYCKIKDSSKYLHVMRTNGKKKHKPYAWNICNRCDLLKAYQENMIKWGEYCLAQN